MSFLKKARWRAEALAARGLLAAISAAPASWVCAMARGAGWIAFHCWRERRAVAVDNVKQSGLAADDREAKRIARASFQTFALMVAETAASRRQMTAENWSEFVELRMSQEAEDLLKRSNQGLIVASGHFGNWEIAARAVASIRPLCMVYRPFNNPYLDQALQPKRGGDHLKLVSKAKAHPMRFLKSLAEGDMVALMVDQHASSGRVATQFFGRRAWTTKSVAMLHLTTRAPLLAAFALRVGPLKYQARVVGPLECRRTGDREADALAITQALTDEIEKTVREHPEQYMWGHRRWK